MVHRLFTTLKFQTEASAVFKLLMHAVLVVEGLLLCGSMASAQSFVLNLPRPSQHAVVTQRIGITDVTVNYHRPLVNKRKVWGGLVPYGQVWRAGANENTTIEFTDPVIIEGKALPRGIYGLHMIPGESEWTVIFSKNSTSWGSFTYDQAEDALRVTAKPQSSDFREALTYDFDDVGPDASVVTLRWEKIAVPFKVGVDTHQIVTQNLPHQLRGLAQYSWDGWDDAANYLLQEKIDLEEALTYSDRSIQNEGRYDNFMTKSRVLEALNRKEEGTVARNKALSMANATQLHSYARQLQIDGKQAEAFAIFKENAKKNPDQWVVHVGMARLYSAQGDFANAVKEISTAVAGAPDGQKQPLQSFAKRLEAQQDINK
jgi:tetratricopeptide (TPR) repeat protein